MIPDESGPIGKDIIEVRMPEQSEEANWYRPLTPPSALLCVYQLGIEQLLSRRNVPGFIKILPYFNQVS